MIVRAQPFLPVLATTATFAAIGPLVGLVLLAGPSGLLLSILFGGLPILFAYVLGLAPAAITGLAAGLSARGGRTWIFASTAIIVGGVSPILLVGQSGSSAWSLSIAGAGAAAVCALLTFRMAGLHPKLPSRIRAIVAGWNAVSILLVVLGIACSVLLVCFAALLFAGPA